jgi:hypothetical protein
MVWYRRDYLRTIAGLEGCAVPRVRGVAVDLTDPYHVCSVELYATRARRGVIGEITLRALIGPMRTTAQAASFARERISRRPVACTGWQFFVVKLSLHRKVAIRIRATCGFLVAQLDQVELGQNSASIERKRSGLEDLARHQRTRVGF